jgi:hypothetical protein
MIQRDAEREGTYMFTIVPSDAPLIVKPRHCCPVGPAQCSSTPVAAGGGALVEVACVVLAVEEGGGEPGDVRVHTWYLSGPHYPRIDISFERTGKKRKEKMNVRGLYLERSHPIHSPRHYTRRSSCRRTVLDGCPRFR